MNLPLQDDDAALLRRYRNGEAAAFTRLYERHRLGLFRFLLGLCGDHALAEEVFHMPVRIGVPKYVGGLSEVVKNPRFSTGVGLLQYGKDQMNPRLVLKSESAGVGQMFQRMKAWFAGTF